MNVKPNRVAVIIGTALLLGPSLTACNLPDSSTCQTLTGGGRGGSIGKSGGTKSNKKTGAGTKPGVTVHSDDDCDDD